MKTVLLYDPYTGRRFCTTEDEFRKYKESLQSIAEELKKYIIRVELNKPFFEKLYEMSGRGY